MGVDNRRREARGELPRFVGAGSGHYRLRTAATEVEQAIERWNDGTVEEGRTSGKKMHGRALHDTV